MPGKTALIAIALILPCAACLDGVAPEDMRSTHALRRSQPCDKWAALAGDVGCALPEQCAIAESCAEAARVYIDCVAEDMSQCMCEEHDHQLNCEGAIKPSEGPARCTAEHGELERCLQDV